MAKATVSAAVKGKHPLTPSTADKLAGTREREELQHPSHQTSLWNRYQDSLKIQVPCSHQKESLEGVLLLRVWRPLLLAVFGPTSPSLPLQYLG